MHLPMDFLCRLHRCDLPGILAIIMLGNKVAVFVQGCFWSLHRERRYAKMPATSLQGAMRVWIKIADWHGKIGAVSGS